MGLLFDIEASVRLNYKADSSRLTARVRNASSVALGEQKQKRIRCANSSTVQNVIQANFAARAKAQFHVTGQKKKGRGGGAAALCSLSGEQPLRCFRGQAKKERCDGRCERPSFC